MAKKAGRYELIICEKPSTASKISTALADGKPVKKTANKVSYYELSHDKKDVVVASAVGHLYTVAEKEKSFKYPSYDVEWRLSADVDKNSAFSKKYATLLKKLAKDASSFTVATDYDIEGETIGLNIVKYLCKQEDANRMKFSTVTAGDLQEAYKEKKHTLNWGQANAGTTRHVLDWLYGINVSRALTTAVKTAGGYMTLSTGRVQGPALRIVVEREKLIKAFIPEDYWQIELSGEKDGKTWLASHQADKFDHDPKEIIEKCKGKDASVEKIESKNSKQQPPNPFDLGSLQRESYRAFGIKPSATLRIAQELYTNAYISYPRTSSQKLPAKLGYRKVLQALAKNEAYEEQTKLLLDKKLLTPNEGKKDDPAHPAIYPTGVMPKSLEGRELKVYDLIVKRFFATFGVAATRETNTVSIVIVDEQFILKGTRTIDPGWHTLYAPYVDLKEEELPVFKQKEQVEYDSLESLKKQTKPPKRYTPSSLITALEKQGLGTKATRADIVEALAKRNYVKGLKSYEVTELGMKIFDILESSAPEIVDQELTRHFEEEMEHIRAQEKTPDDVIKKAEETLTKLLKNFKKTEKTTGESLLEARKIEQDTVNTLSPCPKCKEGILRIMFSRKTKRRFIGCGKYPDCDAIFSLPQAGMVEKSDNVCEHCSFPMVAITQKRRGKKDECINPECPVKKKAEDEQKAKAKEAGEGSTCKKCNEGTMVLRKSMYGMFLGCDKYPKCKTIVKIPKE
ncbi:MAG: DNA topoisomerase I [Candidatus Woesearchaeota archaeon]|nr:DNA topoisomerase I [Candidatus Woesearchaeota archaeon]